MNKSLKIIIGIIFGFLFFLAGCRFLNMMLVEDDMWTKILFHSYYTREKNVDYAFIGSSHVLCDVEPFLLDGLNGGYNFNMSSPQQRMDTSYYLLREMADQNQLKHVYLECYYLCMTDHEIWDRGEGGYRVSDYIGDPNHFASAWLISNAMKPSLNSLAIRMHASDKDHMLENIFPFVRYREKLFDWGYMSGRLSNNMSRGEPEYFLHLDYVEPDGSEWCQEYRDKGDLYSTGRNLDSEKKFPADRDLTRFGLGTQSEKYLRKSIEYCKKKNIPVTVFVSPVMDFQLLSTGDYDNYVRELKAVVDEYEVPCYDFNLIKTEYLDIKHGEYFMDPEHLNTKGSEVYTKVLWDIVNRSEEKNKEVFYNSYEESLANREPEIFGVYYRMTESVNEQNEDGSPVYSMREFTVASNRKDMRYRITAYIESEDGSVEEKLIGEDFDGRAFAIPADQHGTILIVSSYEGRELSLLVNL